MEGIYINFINITTQAASTNSHSSPTHLHALQLITVVSHQSHINTPNTNHYLVERVGRQARRRVAQIGITKL